MSKGAVLDEALIGTLGFADQLLTLTGPIENQHHPQLQEPMFQIRSKEVDETIYLERKYVFDNQVSIKSTYGSGDRVLVWLQRVLRGSQLDAKAPAHAVLLAREFFLLGDWREFQRFKQFMKSMRILDAQARQWLSDHHADLPKLAQAEEGVHRILLSLGNIAEWPDLDSHGSGQRTSTLEQIAKTYAKDLAPVRRSPGLPQRLLMLSPDVRFNVFRILAFVEDPEEGTGGLAKFLMRLAAATGEPDLAAVTQQLRTSRDLSRAFGLLRAFLMSSRMARPPA
jgi:hypothetical protein